MANLIDIIDDAIRDLTEDTTPDIDADFVVTSDTSATGPKKVKPRNFLALYALLASPAFTGNPTAPTQSAGNNSTRLATTAYVEAAVAAMAAGLAWKQPVRVATTGAGTLATSFENGDTVDGVVLATGDRILIKDQASATENGIYVVAASGAPARASDADAGSELVNASVYVSEGTANADKQFVCTTNATITIGATNITFTEFSSGSSSDSFKTIAVSGQSDVVADSATDTLTLAAGSGITITTNAGTDTVTIAATGGGGVDLGKVYAMASGLALP